MIEMRQNYFLQKIRGCPKPVNRVGNYIKPFIMKHFKLIALLVCSLAFCSAFVSQKKSSDSTFSGWSLYPGTGPYCYYHNLDWGYECDKTAYGDVCTIGGGGYIAYASEFGCEYKIDTEILYRDI
jgi:hypothetical protein